MYKNDGPYQHYVDIKGIAELSTISWTKGGPLVLGSLVTLTTLIDALKGAAAEDPGNYEYAQEMATHVRFVANPPVRNVSDKVFKSKKHDTHQNVQINVYTVPIDRQRRGQGTS